jgi:hypothetical protein
MVREIIGCVIAALAAPALSCEMPDEGGMPLRRAVGRIENLSEVSEWAREMIRTGVKTQYVVRLDEPVHRSGRCYWPVEVRGDGKLWRRYLISPDGKSIRPHD